MDNLNILYVAFTRAEHNLLILTKAKEKLDEIDKINAVSDLLQFNVSDLEGDIDSEKNSFTKGHLDISVSEIDQASDNLLKQTPKPWEVAFVSEELKPGQSIFKQSNKSREFVNPEAPSKERYVAYGNVMHALFEHINTLEDIDDAIENHISEGYIQPDEKQEYKQKILSAIKESGTEDWFSGAYVNYKESTILMEENGELKQKRPDRVLFSENSTLVVDFKFGEPHNAHKKQVKQYATLLEDMHYPKVKGYLWYVEERRVEEV
jgi:ATP-dependent exoDNAse (exonuclease V) beta subunit